MDLMAITMEERVEIDDKYYEIALAPAGSSRTDNVSSDAKLDIFAASQQGKTEQIRALIESGAGWRPSIYSSANPRLFDTQGFNCIHSAIRSLNNWALVYLLCQPDVAVDERDHMGRTALHWAVGLPDDISTQILLKMGADPNAMDCDGFTPLHRAALAGSTWHITDLLEAGADIRAKNRDGHTALEIVAEYHEESVWTWKSVVEGLGFKPDGTRIRRPLSEPSVNIIAFSVPSISLGIAFTIASVFPWYMSIVLSPLALVAMHYVRKSLPLCDSGGPTCSHSYAWVTRLRYVFCDPGICMAKTKDALKPIIEDLVQGNRFNEEEFCVKCMTVKPPCPKTWHCFFCKKCVTHGDIMAIHAKWMLNCIGVENYTYFMVHAVGLFAYVLVFDYLVWIHLLALKDISIPSRSYRIASHWLSAVRDNASPGRGPPDPFAGPTQLSYNAVLNLPPSRSTRRPKVIHTSRLQKHKLQADFVMGRQQVDARAGDRGHSANLFNVI
ncbi:ankyrin repeat-containing domain protein [Russula vinacea]|nr:ankyrin repeat-containing domain protein [Russula vinacea]